MNQNKHNQRVDEVAECSTPAASTKIVNENAGHENACAQRCALAPRFNLIGPRVFDRSGPVVRRAPWQVEFAAKLAAGRLPRGPATGYETVDDGTRVARILWAAYSRCTNPRVPNYANYGGRGITFCSAWRGWQGVVNFLDHIGPRPSTEHTLDRIDNDGNYEPGNVRWATRQTQNLNRRGYGALREHPETPERSRWRKAP